MIVPHSSMTAKAGPVRRWVAVPGLVLALSAPLAGWTDAGAQALSSQQLRDQYLECERVSSRERMSLVAMAWCASVSDVLVQRDFGGDMEKQLAWWRKARADYTPAAARRERPGSPDLD